MLKEELINVVRREIKGLSTQFEEDDYVRAYQAACRDTSFSAPTTSDFQIKWLIERMKRALFFSLQSESAHKFKAKQYSLQHRFEHYKDLVKTMDTDFYRALSSYPHEFANVNATHLFGTKADAGFAYDYAGRDRTYDDDNLVVIGPKDSQ